MRDIEHDFVNLAKLALSGQTRDALLLIRRSLPDLAKRRPELAAELGESLSGAGGPSSRERTAGTDPSGFGF